MPTRQLKISLIIVILSLQIYKSPLTPKKQFSKICIKLKIILMVIHQGIKEPRIQTSNQASDYTEYGKVLKKNDSAPVAPFLIFELFKVQIINSFDSD